MADRLRISNVRFARAPTGLIATGLHGWVTLTVNGDLDLGYIGVRRTRDGRKALSFPADSDGAGVKHAIVKPLRQDVRSAIEGQVFAALRARGIVP